MTFVLESPAFRHGDAIPEKYSRKGENVSPPLVWSGAPEGTRSFMRMQKLTRGRGARLKE